MASVLWHDGQRWEAAAKTWGIGGPKIWGWVNTYDITIFNMGGINIHSPAIGTYWHLGCQDLVNHINEDLHGF